jgi:fatty acid synthase subunit alpha
MDALKTDGGNVDKEYFSSRASNIEKEARGQEKEALACTRGVGLDIR